MKQYVFPFPAVATSGAKMLGFRLDAFSAAPSSAVITNVSLGFRGIRETFSLSFVGQQKDGAPVLQLNAPKGFNYAIQRSTNLLDWTVVALLANENGAVRFTDLSVTNALTQFYRAVVP
jgi:hypothetical protein